MSEYTNLDDAIAHQEWIAEHYIVDVDNGVIIKSED